MAFVSGTAEEVAGGDDAMRSTWRIGGGEVRRVVEGLVKKVWKDVEGVDLPGWFQVMPYEVAMDVVSSNAMGECAALIYSSEVRLGQARYTFQDVCESLLGPSPKTSIG